MKSLSHLLIIGMFFNLTQQSYGSNDCGTCTCLLPKLLDATYGKWIAYKIDDPEGYLTSGRFEFLDEPQSSIRMIYFSRDSAYETNQLYRAVTWNLNNTPPTSSSMDYFIDRNVLPNGPVFRKKSPVGALSAEVLNSDGKVQLYSGTEEVRVLNFDFLDPSTKSGPLDYSGKLDTPEVRIMHVLKNFGDTVGTIEGNHIDILFSNDSKLLAGWNQYGIQVISVSTGETVYRISKTVGVEVDVKLVGDELFILGDDGNLLRVNSKGQQSLNRVWKEEVESNGAAISSLNGQPVIVWVEVTAGEKLRINLYDAKSLNKLGEIDLKAFAGNADLDFNLYGTTKMNGKLVFTTWQGKPIILDLNEALKQGYVRLNAHG